MVQAIKRDEVYIEPEGIYVETHQPERRSRKPPLLLVHGVLTGSWLWSGFAAYFAERGWEAHAMNFRGHYTSDLADRATTSMSDFADDIGVAACGVRLEHQAALRQGDAVHRDPAGDRHELADPGHGRAAACPPSGRRWRTAPRWRPCSSAAGRRSAR